MNSKRHSLRSGERPPLAKKPHIDKCGGEWLCGFDDALGVGSTPFNAYLSWCEEVAKEHLAWRSRLIFMAEVVSG